MSTRPLLGEYVGDSSSELVSSRRRVAQLEQLLKESQNAANQAIAEGRAAINTVQNLRRAFGPMYEAMRPLFEGLELTEMARSVSGLSARWEMLKKRLGTRQADIIEVLQHGPMTSSQMSAALHWDIRTTQKHISAMKVAGYLSKNGNQFSLRET